MYRIVAISYDHEYTIEQHSDMGYAVFKAVRSQSGYLQFRQQISNWYVYKGNALRWAKSRGISRFEFTNIYDKSVERYDGSTESIKRAL